MLERSSHFILRLLLQLARLAIYCQHYHSGTSQPTTAVLLSPLLLLHLPTRVTRLRPSTSSLPPFCMSSPKSVWSGACHCGAVRFEATLTDGFNTVRRCNCSYCRMRGAVAASAEMGGVKLLQGDDVLTTYRFNTGTAQHFFCSRCGIYTHHQRRSNTSQYGVNVACLEGVSPFDFAEVLVLDGINHTSDTGKPQRIAGTISYKAAAE